MGRFELNLDCHVTALQAQSKLAISPSYEVRFCSMSTCWKDNFNTFPMDPAPRLYLFCTSRSCQNKCQVMLSPCVFSLDESGGILPPDRPSTSLVLFWPSNSDPRLAHGPAQQSTLRPCLLRPAALLHIRLAP